MLAWARFFVPEVIFCRFGDEWGKDKRIPHLQFRLIFTSYRVPSWVGYGKSRLAVHGREFILLPTMEPKLLLFDIDCTLIDTGGAGMNALGRAAEEFFGDQGPPLDLAGSTDSGIVRSLFTHFGQEYCAEREKAYYQIYLGKLRENLADDSFDGRILGGVQDLLEACSDTPHTLGLLTGNIAEGAAIKTAHYGLSQFFSFGAYGDDHWDRNQLGPIALERAPGSFTGDQAIVIGDTPKDIACGKAFGARTIAVATGKFRIEEMEPYEPDLLLEDLAGSQVLNQILRES